MRYHLHQLGCCLCALLFIASNLTMFWFFTVHWYAPVLSFMCSVGSLWLITRWSTVCWVIDHNRLADERRRKALDWDRRNGGDE